MMDTQALSSLRTQLRHQRRALSPQRRAQASAAVVEQLRHSPIFQQSRHCGLYASCEQEIDVLSLLSAAPSQNRQLYLPCMDFSTQRLSFVPYDPDHTLLQPNAYGILEPPSAPSSLDLPPLDLLCLPLVAFDRLGHRIGRGAGYYDRTLALWPERPFLIGLAYDFQEIPCFQPALWDIPLSMIITETQIIQP